MNIGTAGQHTPKGEGTPSPSFQLLRGESTPSFQGLRLRRATFRQAVESGNVAAARHCLEWLGLHPNDGKAFKDREEEEDVVQEEDAGNGNSVMEGDGGKTVVVVVVMGDVPPSSSSSSSSSEGSDTLALHCAARNGDVAMVRMLLGCEDEEEDDEGVNYDGGKGGRTDKKLPSCVPDNLATTSTPKPPRPVASVDGNDGTNTPLAMAAEAGHTAVVAVLLAHGAANGHHCLRAAASNGQLKLLRWLLRPRADDSDDYYGTPAHVKCCRNEEEEEATLHRGLCPHARHLGSGAGLGPYLNRTQGKTALSVAISCGEEDAVRLLLEGSGGGNADAASSPIFRSDVDCILAGGGGEGKQQRQPLPPYDGALRSGSPPPPRQNCAVKFGEEERSEQEESVIGGINGSPNPPSAPANAGPVTVRSGITALHEAVLANSLPIIDLLLSVGGADVSVDSAGLGGLVGTPLHWASAAHSHCRRHCDECRRRRVADFHHRRLAVGEGASPREGGAVSRRSEADSYNTGHFGLDDDDDDEGEDGENTHDGDGIAHADEYASDAQFYLRAYPTTTTKASPPDPPTTDAHTHVPPPPPRCNGWHGSCYYGAIRRLLDHGADAVGQRDAVQHLSCVDVAAMEHGAEGARQIMRWASV